MRMLVVLLVVVSGLAVVVARRPAEFRVERTTVIAAPPAAVFAQVNDFHRWQAWNPWGKMDPSMTQRFEGSAAGAGAVYTWSGNRQVGEGRMTIVDSRPDELIRIRLEFLKPLPGESVAEFTFAPQNGSTLVTWRMAGTNSFLAKAIHLAINMDRMIGGQFDRGLADMKAVVEAAPPGEPRS